MVQDQKKGLGKFGQTAVDLANLATQTVLDIGLIFKIRAFWQMRPMRD